jgi:hypothetical protein
MSGRLALRLMVGTAWAAASALAGLLLLSLPAGAGGLPVSRWTWGWGGWSLLANAQVVFSLVVANRLFPHANPWLSGLVELAAGLAMVVCGILALFGWVAGW